MNIPEPLVSIVIPALNEGQNLVDTVRYVWQNSDYEPLEVIIVDDGSHDGCVEAVIEKFSDRAVRVVWTRGAGVAGARNAGAAASEGQILVFLDGHCYVPSGWLPPLTQVLKENLLA